MKYDFTSIIDRRGYDALAVEGIGSKFWGNEPSAPREGFDAIPMWVADMNFPTRTHYFRGNYKARQTPALWLFRAEARVL